MNNEKLKYYQLLSSKWPTKRDVISEIINLEAIVSLPKGTEHFISDIHGENEHFLHIIKTASGVIKAKIDDVFKDNMSYEDKIRLANLIYYPEEVLKNSPKTKSWYKSTLLNLINVCNIACGKYTRSKVRKALPEKYAYIIDELLNCDSTNINKEYYYAQIIETIINLGCTDDFIIEIANVIRTLSIDHLHVIGDIFDRGPRSDICMDLLMKNKSLDITWGNHDILWMGAMMGSDILICIAVANSLKYQNTLFLEEGYGVSLRQLERFSENNYKGKNTIEKMYKAISIIRFKLEDMIMAQNKEFNMQDKTKLDKIDYDNSLWNSYKIDTSDFSLINKENPCELPDDEIKVIKNLKHSFLNSEKMQKHLKFLLTKGSIYLCYNNNLLYHGCIPVDEEGNFKKVCFDGKEYYGKSYMDFCDTMVRQAYLKRDKNHLDFMWYMWCGTDSPLFGKKNMATFERMFVKDTKAHIEEKQPYFIMQDNEKTVKMVLTEFGLDSCKSHIINGHIPVKLTDGESPIKANGRLITIDGGMSKTYRKQTGIAGYTLTYNSYGLILTSHYPFESVSYMLKNDIEMMSSKYVVEKVTKRVLVGDTDNGKKLKEDISDLIILMKLYEDGIILEK